MADDDFMAAVKELTTAAMAYGVSLATLPQVALCLRRETAAMAYGVSLATEDGGSRLRAALMKADPHAPIGESLAPFVDSLLTLRPRLVDQLRGDDRG